MVVAVSGGLFFLVSKFPVVFVGAWARFLLIPVIFGICLFAGPWWFLDVGFEKKLCTKELFF